MSLPIAPTPPTAERAVAYPPVSDDLPPWELALACSTDDRTPVLSGFSPWQRKPEGPGRTTCALLSYGPRTPNSPDEAWSWPGGTYRGWTAALVGVETHDGLVGIGEIGDGLPAPDVVPAVLEHLAPSAVGADPRQVRSVLHRMRPITPTWARRGLAVSVLSGVEAALFDVVGKATGLPAHALLGGARWPTLPVYASGGLDPDPDVLRSELQAYVCQGYRPVKVRIVYGTDKDLAIAETARAAVSNDVHLMFDAGAPYLPRPPHRKARQPGRDGTLAS